MTSLLIASEVQFLARTTAFRVLLVAYTAWVGFVTCSWLFSPPVDGPVPDAFPLRGVLLGTLTFVVPWLVARQVSDERASALVDSAGHVAAPPEDAVMAKVAATFVLLAQLYVLTIPIGILAWAAGQADTRSVAASMASLICLHAACVVLSYHACVFSERRVSSWVFATADTAAMTAAYLVVAARAGDAAAGAAMLVCAVALLAWLRARARSQLLYVAAA